MQPAEPDKGQIQGLLKQLLRKIDEQAYLLVLAIAIIFVLALARNTSDLRFVIIVTVVAILTLSAIFIVKFFRVEKRQESQQAQINQLVTALSDSVFRHLAGIYILKDYKYRQNYEDKDGKDKDGEPVVGDLFMRECYYLKHHGFIEPATLEFDTRIHKKNLAELASPSELGRLCLRLRNKDILDLVDEGTGKNWVANVPDMRKNLNIKNLKTLGFKIQDDGTISL
jgi:hypothetical protein